MKKLLNISLRAKIILMALTLNIGVVVGAFFSIQKLGASYEKAHFDEFDTKTQQIAAAVANQFHERYGDVQAFSKNESIRLFHTNRMQKDLNEYVKTYGVYDLILVLDKNGKLIGNNQLDINQKPVNQESLSKFNFSQTPWFQAALNGQFTEDKSKNIMGTYFGDVAQDETLKLAFGEDRIGARFSTQIHDYEGNIVGVIATISNTRWYDTVMEEFYSTVEHYYPNTELTILNKDGYYVLQHFPVELKDTNKKVVHNSKLILKEKFFVAESEVSKALKEHKSGATTEVDQVDNNEDIVGYSYINHPKWISSIGWSILFHNEKAEVLANVNLAKTYFYWIMGIVSLLGLGFSAFAGIKLSKSVETITEELAENSKQLDEASVKIASGATQLSESATEQASALQETVSTMDQMSSMIQKNSDAAQKSKELSAESKSSTEQGRQTIDSMMLAINEIQSNNSEVSQQMTQTNAQLSEITKMIHNISNKTKVINEIVFQTKLLSFNASVEAARAGEYGKGFAVVAEEVGKLAQMSGGAAKEITEMLQESVTRVDYIIHDTRSKVDKLMEQSKDKVNFGSETAKQCKQALDEIAVSVQTVDQLVSEIAVASKEQSAGVVQISQAINQLEAVTNQNSSVAQSSSVAAEQLRSQAGSLNHVVEDLAVYVHGNAQFKSVEPKSKEFKAEKTPTLVKVPTSKVLAFEPKKVAPKRISTEKYQPVFKNASGYDAKVPSANDPGFSEE